jgi:hypothetical protein
MHVVPLLQFIPSQHSSVAAPHIEHVPDALHTIPVPSAHRWSPQHG